MTPLPNPFEFNCSVGPETVGQSAAGPCITDPTAPAAANFNSAQMPSSAEAVAAIDRPAPEAATVVISVSPGDANCSLPSGESESSVTLAFAPGESSSAAPLPAQAERADTAGIVHPAMPAAFPADTQLITEHFSDYAHRLSMPIVSPPLNAERIGLNAVRSALNIHPRDLDLDPPPLFLRKPRPAFLRALLELGSPR